MLENCFFVEGVFEQFDHVTEGNRMCFSEIDDLELAGFIVNSRGHAADDVIYVCVIALTCSIAIDRNGALAFDHPRKFVNRQVWTLSRTIYRKETQAENLHIVKMTIGVREQFT